MRHKLKGRKLGSSYGHTKAMKVGLVQALFLNDRIKTTQTRAKEIRGDVDKLITWAKKGDLHSRRLAIAALGNNKELVREIFEKVNQGMFEGRNGGYTRILKLGPRKGDGAPMVIMELVNETVVPKTKKAAPAKAAKKATPSKKAVKDAEADIKAEEKAAEADHENVLQKIHDNMEAAEETFAENVREAGEEQLAEEKAEVAKEDAEAAKKAGDAKAEASAEKAEAEAAKEAEEVREEKAKAEEADAKDAEAGANPADAHQAEEHA